MTWRPPKGIGLLAGSLIGLTLLGLQLILIASLRQQGLGLGFYASALALLGSLVLLGGWALNMWHLVALSYRMDRNVFVIDLGWRRYVVPMDAIERVLPAQALAQADGFRGQSWPGLMRGRAHLVGLPPLVVAATEPFHRQMAVVTRQCTYAISPTTPDGFVQALEARRALGRIREATEGLELAPLAQWPIWRDRLFWLGLGLALLLNLALYALILARYGGLPERLPLHFGPLGAVDRIASKAWLLGLPGIGSLALGLNALLALALYARERLGSRMLVGMALMVQIVLWLATGGLLP